MLLPYRKIDLKGIIVYCGLYIEVKTPDKGSRLTDAQRQFRDYCPKAGYRHVVVRTATEGIEAVIEYLGI